MDLLEYFKNHNTGVDKEYNKAISSILQNVKTNHIIRVVILSEDPRLFISQMEALTHDDMEAQHDKMDIDIQDQFVSIFHRVLKLEHIVRNSLAVGMRIQKGNTIVSDNKTYLVTRVIVEERKERIVYWYQVQSYFGIARQNLN